MARAGPQLYDWPLLPLPAIDTLGDFRLEGGTGTIRPQLTIVGTDRSQQSISVGEMPPVPKKTRAR
jgi:hypothetical protein